MEAKRREIPPSESLPVAVELVEVRSPMLHVSISRQGQKFVMISEESFVIELRVITLLSPFCHAVVLEQECFPGVCL